MEFADLTGKRFGRLIAAWPVGRNHGINWLCFCDCGNFVIVISSRLGNKHTQSCGCFRKELNIKRSTKHGLSESPEYRIYSSAKARCENEKNKGWKDYGGRGIQFLFKSFDEFYNHLGSRPTPKHTLERMENDGHYEVSNTKWATHQEQMNNRRLKRIENFSDEQIQKEYQRRFKNGV